MLSVDESDISLSVVDRSRLLGFELLTSQTFLQTRVSRWCVDRVFAGIHFTGYDLDICALSLSLSLSLSLLQM